MGIGKVFFLFNLSLFSISFSQETFPVCPGICREEKGRAESDCSISGFPLVNCVLDHCKTSKGRDGWTCNSAPQELLNKIEETSFSFKNTRKRQFRNSSPKCSNVCRTGFGAFDSAIDCLGLTTFLSGCRYQRCKKGNRLGWTCTSGQQKNSFKENTFRNSLSSTGEAFIPSTNSNIKYKLTYDVKLIEKGVISIASLGRLLKSFNCYENGKIKIELSQNAPVGPILEDMYPPGSIIFIERESLGVCSLSSDRNLQPHFSESEAKIIDKISSEEKFADTYAYIEAVTGSRRNAILTVKETTFHSMFQEGDIGLSLIRSDILGRRGTKKSNTLSSGLGNRTDEKSLEIELTRNEFSVSKTDSICPIELKTTGKLKNYGHINKYKATWDTRNIVVDFSFVMDLEVSLEVDVTLSVSKTVLKFDKELLSRQIYGIPPIDLFKETNDTSIEGKGRKGWITPKLKLGFYAELPLVGSANLKLEKKFVGLAITFYRTARSEINISAEGKFSNLIVKRSTRTISKANSGLRFISKVSGSEPFQMNVNAFLGVRPQIALYAVFFLQGFLLRPVLNSKHFRLN